MHYIYGLRHPGDRSIHYIGRSTDPPRRLLGHISESLKPRVHIPGKRDKRNWHKCYWILSLLRIGLEPEVVVLDAFETKSAASAAERTYISFGHETGWPLTNLHEGGCGGDNGVFVRLAFQELRKDPVWVARQAAHRDAYRRHAHQVNLNQNSLRLSCQQCSFQGNKGNAATHLSLNPDHSMINDQGQPWAPKRQIPKEVTEERLRQASKKGNEAARQMYAADPEKAERRRQHSSEIGKRTGSQVQSILRERGLSSFYNKEQQAVARNKANSQVWKCLDCPTITRGHGGMDSHLRASGHSGREKYSS